MSRTFLDIVSDAARADDLRLDADDALAAVLLDRAQMSPGHLTSGVHAIRCGDPTLIRPVAAVLDAAAEAVGLKPRTPVGFRSSVGFGTGEIVILAADDGRRETHADCFVAARRRGVPVVGLGESFDNILPDLLAIGDRTWALPAIDARIFEDVVQTCTGDDVDCGYGGMILARDVIVCVAPETTGKGCIDNLAKLTGSRENARRGDIHDFMAGLDDAQPLGAVAQRVVTKLRDLHGYGTARDWGMRLADDLRAYRAGDLPWSDVDKGLLLSGPPGSGKTFYARALAAETGCELVVTGYHDWHAGTGDAVAKALKALFADVRKRSERGPVILFVDEIDSIGSRGAHAHNDSFYRPIVNSWLQFLDGSEPRDGVVVVGATNSPEAVDPALLRPGRLETTIEIPAPVISAIVGIILHHAPSVHDGIEDAARACRGLSPAKIAMVCREARRAARLAKRPVTSADIVAAVAAGRPVRSRDEDDEIALHETGHAVVAALLEVPVLHVDLDAALTRIAPMSPLATRADLEKRLAVLLAGRIANALYGDGATIGACEDLAQATQIATSIAATWGMGGRLATLCPEAAAIDPAVKREVEGMLAQADAKARELLGDKWSIIKVREALVAQRYLDGDEVRAIVDKVQAIAAPSQAH